MGGLEVLQLLTILWEVRVRRADRPGESQRNGAALIKPYIKSDSLRSCQLPKQTYHLYCVIQCG